MSQLKTKLQAILAEKETKLLPTNIRAGVTVMGVEGNLEPDKPDQNKTVTPSTQTQNVVADTGYELAQVTVNGVTSAIDNNIQAANIKKDVTILGVTGTLEEGTDTSDADAVASELIKDKTAYVNDTKITGSMPHISNDNIGNPAINKDIDSAEEVVDFYDNGHYFGITFDDLFEDSSQYIIPDNTSIVGVDKDIRTQLTIKSSVLATCMNLTADKIVQGNTIIGIQGTAIPENPEHADYDDCVEIADEILGVEEPEPAEEEGDQ